MDTWQSTMGGRPDGSWGVAMWEIGETCWELHCEGCGWSASEIESMAEADVMVDCHMAERHPERTLR